MFLVVKASVKALEGETEARSNERPQKMLCQAGWRLSVTIPGAVVFGLLFVMQKAVEVSKLLKLGENNMKH